MDVLDEIIQESQIITAALSYANRGWPVIPVFGVVDGLCTCRFGEKCRSSGKHPLTTNGLKDGTTDEKTIRSWWNSYPSANIGIVTGRASGLLMLGPDGEEGIAALNKLVIQHGALPHGPRSRSGGNGQHYLFRYPTDAGITIAANLHRLPIDVRGEGGYFVAPPSMHKSGRSYAWEVSPEAAPVPDAPPWLIDFLTKGPNRNCPGRLTVQADNLCEAVGVAEGQRHDVACRLVGIHLARGDSPEVIEPLALAWAQRCQPPMPEAEIREIVSSLALKHGERFHILSLDDDLDRLILPPTPPWPTLPPEALHGLMGEVVHTIEPVTEGDPVGVLTQLLGMTGNLIGRNPYFQIEGSRHYANLFQCLVGESARGRKGVAHGRAVQLLQPVDTDWVAQRMVTGLASGEGLIYAVRDAVEKTEQVRRGGQTRSEKVVVDEGIIDKRLLVTESEFGKTLRVMLRDGNILSNVLREAWDNGDLRTLVKNSPNRATGAHISLIGHITRQELHKYLGQTEMFNGFANRFLWICVRRSKLLPEGGGPVNLAPLSERLRQAVQVAKTIGPMSRSPETARLWRDAYVNLTSERPGLYGAVTSRAEAQTLRLSMLYALLDGSSVIGASHLRAALSLWHYCEGSACLIFGKEDEVENDPLLGKLLSAIRSAPQGATRSDLHRATNRHLSAQNLVKALAKLRDKGLAHCRPVKTGGRDAETWFPGRQSGEGSEPSERTNLPPTEIVVPGGDSSLPAHDSPNPMREGDTEYLIL